MGFTMRFVPLFTLVAALLSAPAQAVDYDVGTSLVCDTQAQVERFVAVFTGDAQTAMQLVNAEEHNPSACAIMTVGYKRGTLIGMARRDANAFEIVRILVVGVGTDEGITLVRPSVYFSLFAVKEYAI